MPLARIVGLDIVVQFESAANDELVSGLGVADTLRYEGESMKA